MSRRQAGSIWLENVGHVVFTRSECSLSLLLVCIEKVAIVMSCSWILDAEGRNADLETAVDASWGVERVYTQWRDFDVWDIKRYAAGYWSAGTWRSNQCRYHQVFQNELVCCQPMYWALTPCLPAGVDFVVSKRLRRGSKGWRRTKSNPRLRLLSQIEGW